MTEQIPQLPILLVDDEEPFLISESTTLTAAGIHNVVECQDSRDVMPLLSAQDFQLIVLDMSMPHVTGWDLLPQIIDKYPRIPIVILSGIDEVDMAVRSIKTGAFDYIVKPVDDLRLVTTVRSAIELRNIQDENHHELTESVRSNAPEHPEAFAGIITGSSKMRLIFQYLEAISQTPLPVLIEGETGVGKEMIASAIHSLSLRGGDLVTVNLAGVDDSLLSDTLFGHKRGGFTGADRDRKGLVEQAAGGTLFLDEIGDLSLESQVKLLRVLQEGMYYPIGSDVAKSTDARFIVATNKNLDLLQQKGQFRQDLYYRLRAHRVHIPPLRDRKDDIPLLVDHFLERAALVLCKKKPTPPRELLTMLENYPFAGNIRELEGIVFDLVSRHKSGVLSLESLRDETVTSSSSFSLDVSSEDAEGVHLSTDGQQVVFTAQFPTLKQAEQLVIEEALKRAHGVQSIAARMLGMSRRALNNRLSRRRR